MTKEEIAATLKLCRIKAGFDAKEVADKLISMGAIKSIKSFYNWESGRTQPDADTFMYLCDLYNVKDIMPTFGYGNRSSLLSFSDVEPTSEGKVLLNNYKSLNNKGRQKLLDYSKDLISSGRYAAQDEDAV